jgi:hypothetical protein
LVQIFPLVLDLLRSLHAREGARSPAAKRS